MRPTTYTQSGAASLASAAWTLYLEFEKKFGSERAWEFVVKFYEGAGRNE